LNVLHHDVLQDVQDDFAGKRQDEVLLADFIDRVSARFGTDCLMTPSLQQSHIPERAEVFMPAIALKAGAVQSRRPDAVAPLPFQPTTLRPLRLFRYPEPMEAFAATVPDGPPQRFRWRKVVHEVVRAEGPERISSEWWRDEADGDERDYFRLESETGRRFWVFRKGRYNGAKDAPLWRVHGIFA
jgi:protein ImuB